MSTPAGNSYMKDQVLTASGPRLHLMLIEGALRFVQQTQQLWEKGEHENGGEALLRGQEIVAELMAGTAKSESELGRKFASIYLFIYRSLVEAHLESSITKLADAARVLEAERETWRQVCERITSPGAATASQDSPSPIPSPHHARSTASVLDSASLPPDSPMSGGVAFEA